MNDKIKYKVKWPVDTYFAGKTAMVLTDNGNGVTVKFKGMTSVESDIYFNFDYSQAAFLREGLNKMENLD